MKAPIWIDQTLNTAVRWQFAGSQLAELAGLLSSLGIRQADICLDDWRWYRPDMSAVANCLTLRGIAALTVEDLVLAKQAGLKQVAVIWQGGVQQLATELEPVIAEAANLGLRISLLLTDLAGLSENDVRTVAAIAKRYHIATVIYADCRGTANPFVTYRQLTILKNACNCPVELRAGNAYGLATANTFAAVKAGVRQLATAIAGVGGFAPWEEALLSARQLGGLQLEVPQNLAERCRQVLTLLELNLAQDKAVIGPEIFAHESGLHVDGVTKSPEIYEPFAPELVGLNRLLVIGKHSGSAAIRTKFAAWGIELGEAETKYLLKNVRALAVSKKAAVTDDELKQLYRSG